ncbi:hypothetical protein Tsubulata_003434 [Turnera subulata]|uniref:Uncharacterized protein n=1 Tax=Turnera subulata TaxID=218843 RepID=A0A9Q0FJR5_9ROSI|nr:hypothetical protein Tsubulata_049846 [Turnera subulata]KAJ4838110.1 hypothetical protein Tsubulata_003434 [Turnera subulata]
MEYSGPISCPSNASFRSSSSTASSHSFTFPILPSEWSGSPIRMPGSPIRIPSECSISPIRIPSEWSASPIRRPGADQRQLQKHQRRKRHFLCCKF